MPNSRARDPCAQRLQTGEEGDNGCQEAGQHGGRRENGPGVEKQGVAQGDKWGSGARAAAQVRGGGGSQSRGVCLSCNPVRGSRGGRCRLMAFGFFPSRNHPACLCY